MQSEHNREETSGEGTLRKSRAALGERLREPLCWGDTGPDAKPRVSRYSRNKEGVLPRCPEAAAGCMWPWRVSNWEQQITQLRLVWADGQEPRGRLLEVSEGPVWTNDADGAHGPYP